MGSILGKGSIEEPKYKVLQQEPFEIRQYSPYVLAEVKMACDSNNNCETGKAFQLLANYIGVGSKTAANEGNKAMPMTAPVTMTPQKMEMTAPVVQSSQYLGFVLPAEFKDASLAPKPLDKRIKLRTVDSKIVAVDSFTWWYSASRGEEHFSSLYD